MKATFYNFISCSPRVNKFSKNLWATS